MTSSFTARVRAGTAFASVAAALLAAVGSSLVASFLLERAVERRLQHSATILAHELNEEPPESLEELVADELQETAGSGIVFAIFDDSGARRLAGDASVSFPEGGHCTAQGALLVCAERSWRGLWVASAEVRDVAIGPFVWATVLAVAFAGVSSWVASRTLARWLTAPLTTLRQRLAALEVGPARISDLGAPSNVVEVDELRAALATLMGRVDDAIRTAERFAADAAHELRTPLTAIRGELELAIEDPSSARTDLARIRNKTVELQALIERILLLALPDAKDAVTELVAVDEIAADVVAELGEDAPVALTTPSVPAVVHGDGVLLAAALTNALSNALKFGTSAAVDVRADSKDVVVTVTDDGPGVRPEMRVVVFQPFVRDVEHARAPGRGLGLAIIANIVRRHAGTVRFLDAERGARLEMRFPRADERSQEARPKRV